MRKRWLVLAAVAVVGASYTAYWALHWPWAADGDDGSRPEYRFLDATVSPLEKRTVIETVEQTIRELERVKVGGLGSFTVWASSSPSELGRAFGEAARGGPAASLEIERRFAQREIDGTAIGGALFVLLGPNGTTTPGRLRYAVAHELGHVYQYHHSDEISQISLLAPEWAIEGFADFFATWVIAATDSVAAGEARNAALEEARLIGYLLEALASLESSHNGGTLGPYVLGALAFQFIAERWGALVPFMTWNEDEFITWIPALEKATGVTIEDFYEQFEAHRAESFAPFTSGIRGAIRELTGRPGTRIILQACRMAECFAAFAREGETYDLRVPPGSYVFKLSYFDGVSDRFLFWYGSAFETISLSSEYRLEIATDQLIDADVSVAPRSQ